MKLLVVHATKSGSTADVATWIADAARASGHEVTHVAADTDPDPSRFDAVIVGSGIRAGNWHTAASKWLANHQDALRTRPFAVFTSSLRAADPDREVQAEVTGYTTKVLEPLDLHPVTIGRLVGAYDPKKVSLPERLIMKALRQAAVDQRDPEAAAQWTRATLTVLTDALPHA